MDRSHEVERLMAWATDYGADSGDAVQSDQQLVESCRSHFPGAWDQLVRRYGRLVYAVARRYGLQEDETADVFQNVWVELWEHLESIRDASVLRRWLVVVASRKSWQVRKSRARWVTEEATDTSAVLVSTSGTSPEEIVLANADWEQLGLVLERLAPRDRELIWYLFFDPTSPTYQTIAERLGVSPDTVGSLRTRCLRRLRWVLAEHTA